jgi:hypothetical protein
MCDIIFRRGTIALKGACINEAADSWVHSVPLRARETRYSRDKSQEYHLTIATCDECKSLDFQLTDLPAIDEKDFHILGLAHVVTNKPDSCEAWYLVVYCRVLDDLRSKLGLPTRQYHITLGFYNADPHGCNDIYKSIVVWSNDLNMRKVISSLGANTTFSEAEMSLLDMILPKVIEACREIDDALIKMLRSIGLAMVQSAASVTYDAMHMQIIHLIGSFLFERGVVFGLKLLVHDALKTKTIPQVREYVENTLRFASPPPRESKYTGRDKCAIAPSHATDVVRMRQMGKTLRDVNIALFGPFKKFGKAFPSVVSMDVQTSKLTMASCPRNFGWVNYCDPGTKSTGRSLVSFALGFTPLRCCYYDPKNLLQIFFLVAHIFTRHLPHNLPHNNVGYKVAGSAYPTTFEQISALHALGIRAIVTVHENAIDSRLAAAASRMGITCHHFHTIDRTPPSLAQLSEICQLMDSVIRGVDTTVPAPASASGGRSHSSEKSGDNKCEGGGGSVLVHCQGGVGRTNTVIAAYIMYAIQVSAADAINMVSTQLHSDHSVLFMM